MIRVRASLSSIGNGILMNPMTEATLEGLRTGVHPPKQKDRPAIEVAEERVIKDAEGNPGIPMEYLFSCLVEAGRHVKNNGKKQISTATSSLLPSFLTIEEAFLPFIKHSDMVVDMRRGRLPKDGTAVCLVRPKFEQWTCEVTLEIDESIANEKTVRELLKVAGTAIGLGDFRPAKRGPFGRFEVASWKVIERNGKAVEEIPADTNGHSAEAESRVPAAA